MGYNTETVYSGLQSVLFYSYNLNSATIQYLITPELNLTDNKVLSFRHRYDSYASSFHVGISYTGNNASDFIWTSSLASTTSNTSWIEYTQHIDPSVKYICIRFQPTYLNRAYYLYVDNFTLAPPADNRVDFCNLETPGTINAEIYQQTEVSAKVFKSGVTSGTGQGSNISVWIGYGPQGTPPHTWSNWVAAQYSGDDGTYDVYKAGVDFPAAGNYSYATRVRYLSGVYTYGGYSQSGGGLWDESTNVSGTATITDLQNCQTPVTGTFFAGFEGSVFPPPCWTVRDANGNTSTDMGYTGQTYYAGTTSTQRQYLITPELNLTDNKLLSFRYKFDVNAPAIYIGISYTGNNPSDFIWSSSITPTTSWREYTQDIDPAVKYICIRFNTSYSDRYLYVDNFTLAPPADNRVDFCNIETPGTINAEIYQQIEVSAKVFKSGVTSGTGQGSNISVWIGYGPQGTSPHTWSNWVVAQYSSDEGTYDVYKARVAFPAEGTYSYATRVRYQSGVYTYGGYSESGGGFWDESTNVSGTATITIPACENAVNYGVINSPQVTNTLYAGSHLWYKFTLDDNYAYVTVSTCGTSFDNKIAVYDDCTDFAGGLGHNINEMGCIAFDDNSCPGTSTAATYTFQTLRAGTYYVVIYGANATAAGTVNLQITGTAFTSILAVDPNSEIVPVNVCKGTPEQATLDALPTEITLQYTNSATEAVPVTWSIANYNAQTSGTYTATGVFALPVGIEQSVPPTPLQVSTTVIVNEPTAVTCPDNITVTTRGATTLSGATPSGGVFTGEHIINNTFNSNSITNGNYNATYT